MSTAQQSRTKAATPLDDTELDIRYTLILSLIDQQAEERKFVKEMAITTEERTVIEPWLRRKEYRVYNGSATGTVGIDLGFYRAGDTEENILVSWQGYEITVNRETVAIGETVSWTIDTVGVPDGDVIYYSTDGTVVSTDFTDNDLSAGVIVTANQATITKTIDAAAVSGHTMDMKIYYDGLLVEFLGQAATVAIV